MALPANTFDGRILKCLRAAGAFLLSTFFLVITRVGIYLGAFPVKKNYVENFCQYNTELLDTSFHDKESLCKVTEDNNGSCLMDPNRYSHSLKATFSKCQNLEALYDCIVKYKENCEAYLWAVTAIRIVLQDENAFFGKYLLLCNNGDGVNRSTDSNCPVDVNNRSTCSALRHH